MVVPDVRVSSKLLQMLCQSWIFIPGGKVECSASIALAPHINVKTFIDNMREYFHSAFLRELVDQRMLMVRLAPVLVQALYTEACLHVVKVLAHLLFVSLPEPRCHCLFECPTVQLPRLTPSIVIGASS
jgi:hypothetical protein